MKKIFSAKPVFTDPVKNLSSAELEINKWSISEFVIHKLVPVVSCHPFPLDELMLMTTAVCRFKPELIFEWGTNVGKSARVFYEIISTYKINCTIHSVDLPDDVFHHEHPQNYRGKFVKGKKDVFLYQADGLSKSIEIYKEKKPKGKVLFFVDGDHSYESVKRELSEILKAIPDAVVLLHDTFDQSDDANYNTGPIRAIREVINGTHYRIISTQGGLPGMSLVYQ
ncbi:MAG: hypothetical protein IAF38_17740 [Bacteroidia bacterium]|nr:hypothetical protein [Bacteroidia bacterium]